MMSVAAMLTKEQIEYLDNLSRKMKETGGSKLPCSAIIRNLVRVLEAAKPNMKGVRDEQELVASLLNSIEVYE